LDVVLGLADRGDPTRADDPVCPRVVGGEHVVRLVPGYVLHVLREFAVVRRRRWNRVIRVPDVTVAVAVPVDAMSGPGAGNELGDTARVRVADDVRIPPALLVELRGEQRRVDGRTEVAPFLNERLVRGGHCPLGERLAHAAGHIAADDVHADDQQHDEAQSRAGGDGTVHPYFSHAPTLPYRDPVHGSFTSLK